MVERYNTFGWIVTVFLCLFLLQWFRSTSILREGYTGYIGGRTKCFSCEADMIARGLPLAWGRPTKSVDAERHYASMGIPSVYAQPIKTFSAEIPMNNY